MYGEWEEEIIVCVSKPLSMRNRNMTAGSSQPCMMTLSFALKFSLHTFFLHSIFPLTCPLSHSETETALLLLWLSEYQAFTYLEALLEGGACRNGGDIAQLNRGSLRYCLNFYHPGRKVWLEYTLCKKKTSCFYNSLEIVCQSLLQNISKEASLPCYGCFETRAPTELVLQSQFLLRVSRI